MEEFGGRFARGIWCDVGGKRGGHQGNEWLSYVIVVASCCAPYGAKASKATRRSGCDAVLKMSPVRGLDVP